ncbi:MAG: (Fe-S)-binding protein [Anaerolineae bacterium]
MSRLDFGCLNLRQLLSLDACTRCGECLPACPILAAGAEDHATAYNKIALWRRSWRAGGYARGTDEEAERGLRGLLRWLARGDVPAEGDMAAAAYDCTLCGRCATVCPVYIQTHDLWLAQRRQLVQAGLAPEALAGLAARVRDSGNFAGRPVAERSSWLENAESAPATDGADVTMFVGCVAGYYPQAFDVARALLDVLQGAGIRVGILGADETCCGFPLYASGLQDEAVAQAQRNLEVMRARGVREIITPCPSCYHVFSERYPEWLGDEWDVRVQHGSDYLLAIADRLRPLLKPLPMRVTYHDPCDLGRLSGVYEVPRLLLAMIPALELVEMAENRENALCCGGGGDVEMVHPSLTEVIADRRFEQAMATGAEAIVTACSQCTRTLSAAARRARQRVRTYDVAELLLRSMRG